MTIRNIILLLLWPAVKDGNLDSVAHGWSVESSSRPKLSDACSQRRRRILRDSSAAVVGSLGGFLGLEELCEAAAPLDAGEAIRRSAANLPGLGPTDVFFPKDWEGKWEMTRQVNDRLKLQYPFRFIPSIDDEAVVADRGFNQASLEAALAKATGNSDAAQPSYEWVPTNPNDLRLRFANGSRKEIKVTKRAILELDSDRVSSSEFQRVTLDDGIPSISARRVLTKWRKIDDNTIEGLEVVYGVMEGVDPMAGSASQSSSPQVLSKSRMLLVRQR